MEAPQTKAELQTATDAMHAAWQRLRTGTRDAQLRRAVRKPCNWLKRVRRAAVVRFFELHVVELEKQLRAHGRPAWIVPKHLIGAAGGDEKGGITVRP